MFSRAVGREETANKYHLHVWGALTVSEPHWVFPHSRRVFFPGRSARELSKAGPGLRALPRSKLLRFIFSGTPQRHRLSWASIWCPSPVRAAQVTRCLLSMLSPGERCILSPLPSHPLGFLAASRSAVSRMLCDPLGADLWL